MENQNEKSFIMAERLKQLREENGYSHEKLSNALNERYSIKISSDSLMNYEVSDPHHTKAGKNKGMRVEYLRCLADFYGVSADYILGANVPRSPNISVQEIVSKTGLAEDNVLSLMAWTNLKNLSQVQNIEELTPVEKDVVDKAARIGSPGLAQYLLINLVRKLTTATLDRADDMCHAFNSYMLCLEDSKKFKWGSRLKSISKEVYMDIEKHGYRIVPAIKAMSHEWEQIEGILRYEIRRSLEKDLEQREKVNSN